MAEELTPQGIGVESPEVMMGDVAERDSTSIT